MKIKIQPGWDVEPVARIREQFPELPLMVDANAAYTIADMATLRELDRFGLMMIEQPLAAAAIDEAGELQSQLKTPLCADESADSITSVRAIDREGCSARHQYQSAESGRTQRSAADASDCACGGTAMLGWHDA